MNKIVIAMLLSVGLLIAFAMSISDAPPSSPDEATDSVQPLVVYCAASNRAVMEKVVSDYEAETGRSVEVQYGASQVLLSNLEVRQTGDLYLPADDSYLEMAREKQLVQEVLQVAMQRGVVAVKKGNPKNIQTLQDLLRDDVRFIQASPDAAAIGRVARKTLQKQGLWEDVQAATVANRTTVTEVANDIVVDAADAAIVYDAVLHTYPDLEYVVLPELAETDSQVAVGVLRCATHPARALHFARYLTAEDRGRRHYADFGFHVESGDPWADVPELSLFAGSMLRPAVDRVITEFEEREGVRVSRVYNGCGILVAQMKGGQRPDAYFACDTEFMQQVTDLFPDPVSVSQNELVILVQKGNPHGIASLKDLGREGLRVGVGHEKQCAMGWLTQNTLREGGVQQEVMKNVTVQTPTGDMLVNQLRTGSLDAAVVYLSNAAGSAEELDAIRIQGIECSVATQPFAIAEQSRYRRLAGRLFERLISADAKQEFLAEGFRWSMDADDAPVPDQL